MFRSRCPPSARTLLLPHRLRSHLSTSFADPSADRRRSASVTTTHPWPEWAELMEMLLNKGYFESRLPQPPPSPSSSKGCNRIRTACLSFARDRPDIFRYLLKKDIMVMVGRGCLNIDRKVVNSAKRLRAYFGIEEANVCRSCELQGRCERAYARSCENVGTTVDIMRILLTFGLNFMTGLVENQLFLDEKIERSTRKLLNLILQFSAKDLELKSEEMVSDIISARSKLRRPKQLPEGKSNARFNRDWICIRCNFLNFSRNIRCLRCNEISQEKLKKLRSDREHLSLKKGDWICSMCKFLNFAKSPICLQCKEKPKGRQLNSGEWECTSCNFINFRRNISCLRCGWKRPKAALPEPGSSHFQQQNMHECSEQPIGDNSIYLQSLDNNLSPYSDATFWSSTEDESYINDE